MRHSEECLELIDALEQGDLEHVEEELDLLFQVIFYSQLGKETDYSILIVWFWYYYQVTEAPPHVFKDGELGVITIEHR